MFLLLAQELAPDSLRSDLVLSRLSSFITVRTIKPRKNTPAVKREVVLKWCVVSGDERMGCIRGKIAPMLGCVERVCRRICRRMC